MKAVKILAASLAFTISVVSAATGVTVDSESGAVAAGGVSVGSAGTSVSLNVEGAPSVVSTTPTSVTLDWKKVEAAVSYIVKYSKKSVATSTDPNAVYDNETAPVTETGATIDKLDEGGTYYFAVVALDKDGNESDSLSEELVATLGASTTASDAAASFALVSVTPKNTRTITLEFSAPIGSGPVEIKLQKTSNSASLPVKEVVADPANPTTATVSLDADLEGDSTYSLTVISAKDDKGTNISEGINAIKEFTTVASLAPAIEVPLNAGSPESASGAAVAASASGAAVTALPATGTKENLILILALLSGLAIVFAFRKKAA
jgi:LPXTG-motif cell wall-anchored protein